MKGFLAVNPESSLYLCKWGQKTAPKNLAIPSAGNFCTENSPCRKVSVPKSTSAKKYRCQKVSVPKSTCAEKYWCRKNPVSKSPRAENFACWKVRVLKCACVGMSRNVPDAEISLCQNVLVPKIPCAENSPCQKGPMPKLSCVETSICQNICSAEWCTCQNVPLMKHPRRNDFCWIVLCWNGLQAHIIIKIDETLQYQPCPSEFGLRKFVLD